MPLRRRLPSIPSAPVCHWFVRELQRYYAAVRLPECVHRRRMVTPFPTLTALDCSTEWIAPWPMHLGSPDSRPRCIHTCSGLRPRRVYPHSCPDEWSSVAFRALGPRGHPEVALFRGSILGLYAPLSTLHWRHYWRRCMTWGQDSWLDLSCEGLAPSDIVPVLIGAPQRKSSAAAARC